MARKYRQKPNIIQHLREYLKNTNKPFSLGDLFRHLRVKDANEQAKVVATIESLHKENQLVLGDDKRYRNKMKGIEVVGTLDMTSGGGGFLITESSEIDVFIPAFALHQALHGDTVKVFMRQTKRRPEGEVMEVLQRARSEFVGVLQFEQKAHYVVVDNRKTRIKIKLAATDLNRAKEGQKVLVRITDWEKGKPCPTGKIIDVLGDAGDNTTEMHAILADYGLPYKFPAEVEQAAEKIENDIESEVPKRKDFRAVTTFTIDPQDAKDFDDALSFRKLDNGKYEVGVHIADVTHYIAEDSILEKEAVQRATSVYLVDRTVPMLPEKLSNGLCSLRPLEEKLCFSAVFEMDAKSKITNCWIGKTVIKSDFRFTYEEAQEIIEGKEDKFAEEILILNKLAQQLRKERFAKGAIGFERTEARFEIDKTGKPLGVYFRESHESHQLVEEFMLLANKSVAEYVGKLSSKETARTFVYRIHDEPNQEKLQRLSKIAQQLGYNAKFGKGKSVSTSLNNLLTDIRGEKAQNLLETLALRCMAKACYSTKNVGHYGLAFDHYTHFTSPIRRYPDMMVHRLLFQYLNNKTPKKDVDYEALCKHSSEMEGLAAEAERSSIKYKMAEYMQDKVGKEYEGVISGVTERGIYVEIAENKIEGMIFLRTLQSDFFYFDEENYRVVGRKTRKSYTLGDIVKIRVERVNMEKKQLDYLMVE
ncbi:MAG: ribonuclease R [Bacteroidales bacterium]